MFIYTRTALMYTVYMRADTTMSIHPPTRIHHPPIHTHGREKNKSATSIYTCKNITNIIFTETVTA